MKKAIIILILSTFANMHCQKIRPYAGFAIYLHTDFSNSIFYNLKTGGEFKISKYLKPEIEFSFLGGSPEDFTKRNENILIQEYSRSVTSINFSICPKIILGNDKELDSYFVILPKYSFSNIQANGNLSTYKNNGNMMANKHSSAKVWNHAIGFGLGYNFNFSNENPDSLCFILELQGVELGDALNQLNDDQNRITTKWTLGIGLN